MYILDRNANCCDIFLGLSILLATFIIKIYSTISPENVYATWTVSYVQ